tara:strand:+ start:246 stop:386 length:141 start_codon:yes stop_codon:yes gene_type:complete
MKSMMNNMGEGGAWRLQNLGMFDAGTTDHFESIARNQDSSSKGSRS